MSIWVTGGNGYIGQHVRRELAIRDIDSVTIDLTVANDGPEAFWADVSDWRSLRKMIRLYERPQAIIHLAAETSVPEGEKNPKAFWETNVLGTFNVAQLARMVGCRMVLASSAAVYGNLGNKKGYTWQNDLRPLSVYGRTKLEAENLLLDYFKDIDFRILRYFNVAGCHWTIERPYSDALMPRIARSLYGDEEFTLNVKSSEWLGRRIVPVRDFIHVEDVATATVETAIRWNPATIANVARGVPVPISDVCERMMRQRHPGWRPTWNEKRSSSKFDIAYSVAGDIFRWNDPPNDLESMITDEIAEVSHSR